MNKCSYDQHASHRDDWQEESRRFKGVAHLYDACRPTYPEALIDALISLTGIQIDSKILEIGSGTGKATLLLVRRGFSIRCIEPGWNLVSVASQALKNYPRVVRRREQWPERPGEFQSGDVAQAFRGSPKRRLRQGCASA
jgi:tRNA1(Val) A37 N6-methylase TrmN6